MVVQCCSCKKVREGQAWGDSIDPDLARAPVSHTYCPVCAKRVIEAHAGRLEVHTRSQPDDPDLVIHLPSS